HDFPRRFEDSDIHLSIPRPKPSVLFLGGDDDSVFATAKCEASFPPFFPPPPSSHSLHFRKKQTLDPRTKTGKKEQGSTGKKGEEGRKDESNPPWDSKMQDHFSEMVEIGDKVSPTGEEDCLEMAINKKKPSSTFDSITPMGLVSTDSATGTEFDDASQKDIDDVSSALFGQSTGPGDSSTEVQAPNTDEDLAKLLFERTSLMRQLKKEKQARMKAEANEERLKGIVRRLKLQVSEKKERQRAFLREKGADPERLLDIQEELF
ncbi:hypothetical protein ADUPG1_011645, partial [Aduncisulcus paluster]